MGADRALSATRIAVGGAVVLGGLLRLATSFQSFWLDEVWSYYLARDLEPIWRVVTDRSHDNNHILNTLFIHWVGDREHWFWYRTLSLATGTAAVAALAALARPWGRLEAWTAALLAAVAYPLVTVSAQARGYAPAILFSLVAVRVIQRGWPEPTTGRVALFWGVACLGLLSHLSFLYAYVGIVAWSAVRALGEGAGAAGRAGRLARWHAVPLLALAGLYRGFYRDMVIGGGSGHRSLVVVAREAIAGAVGTPDEGPAVLVAVAVGFAATLAGLVRAQRERSPDWLLLLCAVLLAPGLLLVVAVPSLLYPRYLVAAVPFFYLLAALALGALFRSSRVGRGLYAVVLVLFLLAHGRQLAETWAAGRTDYADTVAYLAEHTPGDRITVGSDHDFRNRLVLRFYARHRDERFEYRERGSWDEGAPRWYLAHSWATGGFPPEQIDLGGGHRYALVKHFPHGPGAGWTWFVYRRDEGSSGSPPSAPDPARPSRG